MRLISYKTEKHEFYTTLENAIHLNHQRLFSFNGTTYLFESFVGWSHNKTYVYMRATVVEGVTLQ